MLKINLLPPELETNKKKAARKALITRFSIGLLVFMVGIAALSLVLTIIQSLNIQSINGKLTNVKAQVSNYKEQEGLAIILKNRLDGIDGLINTDSPQLKAFSLITDLLPSDVKLLTFSVDKKSTVLLGGETNSTTALQTFFDNLTDPSKNQNKVKKVRVDSLSLGVGSLIKFDLVINLVSSDTK